MRFNKLIPELVVSDYRKSLRFYTEKLRFKLEYSRPENKFAFLSFQSSQIMIQETNGCWQTGKLSYSFGRGINLQIDTRGVEKMFKTLRKKDVKVMMEPAESWYRVGRKMVCALEILVQDPDGYLLRFAEEL